MSRDTTTNHNVTGIISYPYQVLVLAGPIVIITTNYQWIFTPLPLKKRGFSQLQYKGDKGVQLH